MRWGLIIAGQVAAVVEQDAHPTISGEWVQCGTAGPGWKRQEGGEFTPPPTPVAAWEAFDFYRRFTVAERVGIRTLAQTNPIAADFIATLDATIASGSRVVANDADLLAGLAYLQTKPEGAPIFTAERAAQLITP